MHCMEGKDAWSGVKKYSVTIRDDIQIVCVVLQGILRNVAHKHSQGT